MKYKDGKILRRIDRRVEDIHDWLRNDMDDWKASEIIICDLTRELELATEALRKTIERVKKCLT